MVAGRHPTLVRRLVIAEANLDPLPASPVGGRMSQRIAAETEEAFIAMGYRNCLEANPAWGRCCGYAIPPPSIEAPWDW